MEALTSLRIVPMDHLALDRFGLDPLKSVNQGLLLKIYLEKPFDDSRSKAL
jgi:hypothetical protein